MKINKIICKILVVTIILCSLSTLMSCTKKTSAAAVPVSVSIVLGSHTNSRNINFANKDVLQNVKDAVKS